MFKLKKILNKHNNAPEFEVQKMSYDAIGVKEAVYLFSSSELTSFVDESEGSHTYYVSYANIGEFDDNRDALCYRITPDMFFEVKCENGGEIPDVGKKFVLYRSFDKQGFSSVQIVSSSQNSDGYVVDASNWDVNKTVLVRFHCKQ